MGTFANSEVQIDIPFRDLVCFHLFSLFYFEFQMNMQIHVSPDTSKTIQM